MENNESKKLAIDLPKELADGVYSNFAVINHKKGEFVLDFCSLMPGQNGVRVKSRIVSNPENVKLFLNALMENINLYESQFGPIGQNEPSSGIRFDVPKGQA